MPSHSKIICVATILSLLLAINCSDAMASNLSNKSRDAKVKPTTSTKKDKFLIFAGEKYVLKEENRAESQYLGEYLPAGQTFENYTRMIAIAGTKNGTTAKDQLAAKVKFVNDRKSTDPIANSIGFTSPDKKSFILDLLISDSKKNIVEQDIWYFTQKNNEVLAYQFVFRVYDQKKMAEFITSCPDRRNKVLTDFEKANLPVPAGY